VNTILIITIHNIVLIQNYFIKIRNIINIKGYETHITYSQLIITKNIKNIIVVTKDEINK